MAPTPVTADQGPSITKTRNGGVVHSTPIKPPELPNDNDMPISSARDDVVEAMKYQALGRQGYRTEHPSKQRFQGASFSKPASIVGAPSGAHSKNDVPSSPLHLPRVKSEEPTLGTHQMPFNSPYQTPTPISAAIGGQVKRFGAE